MIYRKPQIIRPAKPHVCGRCGGFDRRWLRDNRRRLGVGWLHGHCKCCAAACAIEDAPNGWMVEFSGVDASMCGCVGGYRTTSLSVDGVYGPIRFSCQQSANSCLFRRLFTSASMTAEFCPGGNPIPDIGDLVITVTYIATTPALGAEAYFWNTSTGELPAINSCAFIPAQFMVFSSGAVVSPDLELIDHPNTAVCGTGSTRTAADGGTVSVYPA